MISFFTSPNNVAPWIHMKNVCYNASSHDFVLFAEEATFDNCKIY